MGYIAFERTLCDTLWARLPERCMCSLFPVLEQTQCRRISVYHFWGLNFLRKAQKSVAVSGENSRKKELYEVMRT